MIRKTPPGARVTHDGSIIFYIRSSIPRNGLIVNPDTNEVDYDYEQDFFDEAVFHLKYKDCKYHTQFYKPTPCKKIKQLEWCSLKGIQINPVICNRCKEREEP